MPWLSNHAATVERTFGRDFFPYGIEENRSTLELFLQYAHEQGVAHRLMKPEDIFPKGIMIAGRI
jgi:4,5-dihydroxyphthalate decarboxylase